VGQDVKIVVVMPAFNAEPTLRSTVAAIPRDWVDELIIVDDNSSDGTTTVARQLGGDVPVELVWHPHNVGYGGNQKTCYLEALRRDADVVVMLHPDGQYEPSLIPKLVEPILRGEAGLVLGSRFAEPGMARAGGMPLYKYIANRALTAIENRVLRTQLTEMHTGYRAYSRELLLTIPFLRNSFDFAFDTEIILQARYFGFPIVEIPAASRYFADASSVSFKPAVIYGFKTLWQCLRFVLHRNGILRSAKFRP
jgi:glycosyltransferase involved in cell wall biosynthesis